MKKRTGTCFLAALFLSLLPGESLSAPLRQDQPARSPEQEIRSKLLKLPGRVLGRGRNTKPTGPNGVTTYLIEEVTLPYPIEVEIRGKMKRVTRAFRITIFGGPFDVRAMPAMVWIGDQVVGVGMEHTKLDAVTAVTFDRSLIREGATLQVCYPPCSELPEKLKLKGR